MGVYGEIFHLLSNSISISPQSLFLEMVEVSLRLIGRDVTKISPKVRFHWDMDRTVATCIGAGTVLY